MAIAAGVTVWLTFGAFLFFPTMHAPALFARSSITLCGSELLACLVWTFGSESCKQRPCAPVAEAARSVAALDIPGLTGMMFVAAAVYGLWIARNW